MSRFLFFLLKTTAVKFHICWQYCTIWQGTPRPSYASGPAVPGQLGGQRIAIAPQVGTGGIQQPTTAQSSMQHGYPG